MMAYDRNYTELHGSELLTALGDDPQKWAIAFGQFSRKYEHMPHDIMWMTGWFCNAIENGVKMQAREDRHEEKAAPRAGIFPNAGAVGPTPHH